jgi:hypothetical protein
MKNRDLEAELHPSVRAARDLRAIADTWPQLLEALEQGGIPQEGGGKRSKRPAAPVPIDLTVSELLAEISRWVYFWCRRLEEGGNWQMPPNLTEWALDVVGLLHELAEHVGFFTEHPDPDDWGFAEAFLTEAHDMRHKAETKVNPTGVRWVPTHMACLDETDGQPCPGEYRGRIAPTQNWSDVPDLICDHNRAHQLTPEELRRVQRHGPTADPSAIRDYLKRLRQQQPAHNLVAALRMQTTATRIVRAARPRRGA